MLNQHRIYRVFQLINSLRTNPPKSPRTLASTLEVSERSIYRYFDLINQLGFEVKKISGGRFYIEADENEGIPFTTQEVEYLTSMVRSVGKKSVLSEAVLQKIGHHTEHEVAARNIYDANLGKIIEQERIEAEQKALQAKAAREEAERIARLKDAVMVTCFKKGFQEVNYQEYITYGFAIENKSDKPIRAIKGTLRFTDLFDDEISSIRFTYDDPIGVGEIAKWNAQTDYNQFDSDDSKLKNKDLEDMKVVWEPIKIIFEDGSSLE